MKYFVKNGNEYTMKREYGFTLLICLGMLGLAILGVWIKDTIVTWLFGILTVLCLISIWSKLVIINMDQKEFILKTGLIGRRTEIPFQDFQNFELVRLKQYLITTNTSLNIRYIQNGKEKSAIIAQGFTTKAMQNLANEIDEILNSNEHS